LRNAKLTAYDYLEQKLWNADMRCSAPHDNAHAHTAAHILALLEHFNWELFDHPPYSPDLAPSGYHLFICLKTGWNHIVSTLIKS
jgi:transposase